MSWAGRANTDWVTNNDILDAISVGAFSIKAGQSIPANNNFITADEATSKLKINALGGATRWPTKGEFVSSITYYPAADNFYITASAYGDHATVCSPGGTHLLIPLYTSNSNGQFNIGDILYVLDGGAYVPIASSSYTRPANWAVAPNTISIMIGPDRWWLYYDIEGSDLLEMGNCSSNPGEPVKPNVGINVSGDIGGTRIQVTSTTAVTSTLSIDVTWVDGGGNYNTFNLVIPNGGTQDTRFTSGTIYDIIGISSVSPSEDANYYYVY